MMMKKASLLSTHQLFWLVWKLVMAFTFGLCALSLLRQQQSQSELSSSVYRRTRLLDESFTDGPKVAFLFIARRNLPLDFLWGSFFENADAASFSIYIHSEPGFAFDERTTRSAFFYNRQLRNSIKLSISSTQTTLLMKRLFLVRCLLLLLELLLVLLGFIWAVLLQVRWGESSMIEAERLLIKAALEDPTNRRFVLLSDSCVPLYNFSYIYNYLMASPRSFVDSFLDKKEVRYNPKMSHIIPVNKWRKGSQWIALIRHHAEVVIEDKVVFPVFNKFCKRRPPMDASKGKKNIKLQKLHNCIPDEHYVQTLLAMSHLENELERRTVTYTLWNQSATNMEMTGWHPVKFSYANAGPQQIKRIMDINNVYYETEYRTEWCSNNSTSVPCFLFARKFSQGAAMRLLSEGVVGTFDAFV